MGLHAAGGFAADQCGAKYVRVKDGFKIRPRHFVHGAKEPDTGVVDQHVQPAPFAVDFGVHREDVGLLARVVGQGPRAEFRGDALKLAAVAAGDGDASSALDKELGGGFSEA